MYPAAYVSISGIMPVQYFPQTSESHFALLLKSPHSPFTYDPPRQIVLNFRPYLPDLTLCRMSQHRSKHLQPKKQNIQQIHPEPTQTQLNQTNYYQFTISKITRQQQHRRNVPKKMINVTLHASYPPTLPGHICDWTVTKVTGEPPVSPEYSQWFESGPSRIETISVLNTMAFRHTVKALMALWMSGLWCRLRGGRGAYWRGNNESQVRFMLDAGVALLVFLLARNESLKSCIAVLAYWAVMCGGRLDALTMVPVFVLAFNNCMVAGKCLSRAYGTWALVLSRVPWTYTNSELASFETFFRLLRPAERRRRRQRRGADETEHDCRVCWSSHGFPLSLPCRRDHLLCAECIVRLYYSGQNRCPFCRLPLYSMKKRLAAACEIAVACFTASCAIGPIFVVLACYKQSSLWATVAILLTMIITAPIVLDIWQLCKTCARQMTITWKDGWT